MIKKRNKSPPPKKMKHLKRDEVCASENKIKHSKKPQKKPTTFKRKNKPENK